MWKDDILTLIFAMGKSHFVRLGSFLKLLALSIFITFLFSRLESASTGLFQSFEAPDFWSLFIFFIYN